MPGYEIACRTGLSPASVSRIMRRARLSRLRDLFLPPPVVRYEQPTATVEQPLDHLQAPGPFCSRMEFWRGTSVKDRPAAALRLQERGTCKAQQLHRVLLCSTGFKDGGARDQKFRSCMNHGCDRVVRHSTVYFNAEV